MAKLLMLLAPSGGGEDISSRVFECKTCGRQFSSFQALGGHRASHRKTRLLENGWTDDKPRVHECSVCGQEFAVGQALGGHMRRHRGDILGQGLLRENKLLAETKRVPWLDLNLPSMEEILHQKQNIEI